MDITAGENTVFRKVRRQWREHIASLISGGAQVNPETLSRRIADTVPAELLRECLATYVFDQIEDDRRRLARAIEQKAANLALDERRRMVSERLDAENRQRKAAVQAKVDDVHERLLADPSLWWRRKASGVLHIWMNGTERKAFRRFAGTQFEQWRERGAEAAGLAGTEQLEFFESSWCDEGPEAYYRMQRLEAVTSMVRETAEKTRIQVTRELLATIFALGDGTQVAWGDATAEQHEQRIRMLTVNAAGVVETAALHTEAIRMIRDAGVMCLTDIWNQRDPDD